MSVCETNELSSRRKSMDSVKLRNPHIIGITLLKEMKHRIDSKTKKKTMSQLLSPTLPLATTSRLHPQYANF